MAGIQFLWAIPDGVRRVKHSVSAGTRIKNIIEFITELYESQTVFYY